MISFESLSTPHHIFPFFNEEIKDDGKGSDLLTVVQQVSAEVKIGPQNLVLSPVLFQQTRALSYS